LNYTLCKVDGLVTVLNWWCDESDDV